MSIAVITPTYNAQYYIKGWYENIKNFADEIIVCDTGSTDDTLKYLDTVTDPRLKVMHGRMDSPYEWDEGNVRNMMLDECKSKYILALDVDEMVGSDFLEFYEYILVHDNVEHKDQFYIARFTHLSFWDNMQTIRLNQLWPIFSKHEWKGETKINFLLDFRGFYPRRMGRLFRNHPDVRYEDKGNHSMITYKNWPARFALRHPVISINPGVCFYHFHYACPQQNPIENRAHQRGKKWKTIPFWGELPDEIKYYGTVK